MSGPVSRAGRLATACAVLAAFGGRAWAVDGSYCPDPDPLPITVDGIYSARLSWLPHNFAHYWTPYTGIILSLDHPIVLPNPDAEDPCGQAWPYLFYRFDGKPDAMGGPANGTRVRIKVSWTVNLPPGQSYSRYRIVCVLDGPECAQAAPPAATPSPPAR